MKFEGVTFVEEAVRMLSKEEFISLHINVVYTDRDKKDRKKILSDVYDCISPPKEKSN